MKFRVFRERKIGIDIKYMIANVDDLVDLKKNRTYSIKNYKEIFGVDRERKGKQLAKDMFTDMMKMMADDMIEKNYAVVFPYHKFGYMSVADNSKINKSFNFNIETSSHGSGLKLYLDPKIGKNNKKLYRARFVRPLRHKVAALERAGHKY